MVNIFIGNEECKVKIYVKYFYEKCRFLLFVEFYIKWFLF